MQRSFLRKTALLSFVAMGAALSLMATAQAADSAAGRVTARQCQSCHGMDGLSKLAEAPNLRGQVEDFLVKALHDFKSGARRNEMMDVIAGQLADEDIANVAAYYSALQ